MTAATRPGSIFAPDFVIAGAPKAGTTSLYSWLATHPGICMSRVKEPLFWCPDLAAPGAVSDADEYAALWGHRSTGQLTGEASAAYLLSSVAIAALLRTNPQIKLILAIRNPVEMAVSLHAMLVRLSLEPLSSFEEAWRIRERRPAKPPSKTQLRPYAELCAVGDHLERFLAVTPAANRHVLIFDDLAREPRRIYREILLFLGLPDDGRCDFPVRNARPRRPSRRLAALQHRLGRAFVRMRRSGSAVAASPQTGDAMHEELVRAFNPQIDKLERLLGRDLSPWRGA